MTLVATGPLTPVDVRRQRVADLERLGARVAAELRSERAALARITGYVERAPVIRDTHPATSNSVRAWARANGYAVADVGRLPSEVRAAYEAAGDARRG